MLHPTAAGTAFLGSGFIVWFTRTAKKMRQISAPRSAGRSNTLYIVWDLYAGTPSLNMCTSHHCSKSLEGSRSNDCEREKKKVSCWI